MKRDTKALIYLLVFDFEFAETDLFFSSITIINVYKNGLIAELIGKINATVHAYVNGFTLITLLCVKIHTTSNGTQVQKIRQHNHRHLHGSANFLFFIRFSTSPLTCFSCIHENLHIKESHKPKTD